MHHPVVLLLSAAIAGNATAAWQKSALARKGLHHASITGRFISPDGNPVAGVAVQIAAGRPRDLPLAAAKSDADGRFRFSDMNSELAPGLAWYPPEQWMSGAMAIPGNSFETSDLGDIRVVSHSIFAA